MVYCTTRAMSPKDKIIKSSRVVIENVKDTTIRNVAQAAGNKQLKIEPASLQLLLNLITASVEEGMHNAHKSFERSIVESLNEAIDDAKVEFDLSAFDAKKN